MLILSFAWTTAAVKAGRKRVTRRDWSDRWLGMFVRAYERGEYVQAYDKSPRNGGKRFGLVKLTARPVRESTGLLVSQDWEDEGFGYLTLKGIKTGEATPNDIWNDWIDFPRVLTVVRFEVVKFIETEQEFRLTVGEE